MICEEKESIVGGLRSAIISQMVKGVVVYYRRLETQQQKKTIILYIFLKTLVWKMGRKKNLFERSIVCDCVA